MAEVDEEAIRREMEAVMQQRHEAEPTPVEPPLFEQNERSNVRHVIGVVSGKGGVGKSFVTGIIAVELARTGARVGILDADVTGPSIPRMFGIAHDRAFSDGDAIVPVETAGGIKVMSANLVLENETDPVVWRGPVVSGALKQFWSDTAWGDIDYLLVDMPPGTSDVALTVFQSLPIEGVVIVSSPQDLVQMVVGKAIKMAQLMRVPVLGIVENMAYIECEHCGERSWPFGPSKLAETAAGYNVNALGQLPLSARFAELADAGRFEDDLDKDLLPEVIDSIEIVARFNEAKQGASE